MDNVTYPAVLSSDQRDAQVMASLDAYAYGWRIGMVFVGAHLLLLGYVMLRSDYTAGILSAMVAPLAMVETTAIMTSLTGNCPK